MRIPTFEELALQELVKKRLQKGIVETFNLKAELEKDSKKEEKKPIKKEEIKEAPIVVKTETPVVETIPEKKRKVWSGDIEAKAEGFLETMITTFENLSNIYSQVEEEAENGIHWLLSKPKKKKIEIIPE